MTRTVATKRAKPKRMGRPPIPAEQRRSALVQVRATAAQAKRWKAAERLSPVKIPDVVRTHLDGWADAILASAEHAPTKPRARKAKP